MRQRCPRCHKIVNHACESHAEAMDCAHIKRRDTKRNLIFWLSLGPGQEATHVAEYWFQEKSESEVIHFMQRTTEAMFNHCEVNDEEAIMIVEETIGDRRVLRFFKREAVCQSS